MSHPIDIDTDDQEGLETVKPDGAAWKVIAGLLSLLLVLGAFVYRDHLDDEKLSRSEAKAALATETARTTTIEVRLSGLEERQNGTLGRLERIERKLDAVLDAVGEERRGAKR